MITVGTVVFCKAGKEKGNFYVVIKYDDKFIYLSDGKTRTIEKPKKKCVKHISLTKSKIDDIDSIIKDNRNKEISRFLKANFSKEKVQDDLVEA